MPYNFELAKQLGIFQGLTNRKNNVIQNALQIGQQAQREMIVRQHEAQEREDREKEREQDRKERRNLELFKEIGRRKEKEEERQVQETKRREDQQRHDTERAQDYARHERERKEDLDYKKAKDAIERPGTELRKQREEASLNALKQQDEAIGTDEEEVMRHLDLAAYNQLTEQRRFDRAAKQENFRHLRELSESAQKEAYRRSEEERKNARETKEKIEDEKRRNAQATLDAMRNKDEELKLKEREKKDREEERQKDEIRKAEVAARLAAIEPQIKAIQNDRKLTPEQKKAEIFKLQREARGLPGQGGPGGPGAYGGRGGFESPTQVATTSPSGLSVFSGQSAGQTTENVLPNDELFQSLAEENRREFEKKEGKKRQLGVFGSSQGGSQGGRGGKAGGAEADADPFRNVSSLEDPRGNRVLRDLAAQGGREFDSGRPGYGVPSATPEGQPQDLPEQLRTQEIEDQRREINRKAAASNIWETDPDEALKQAQLGLVGAAAFPFAVGAAGAGASSAVPWGAFIAQALRGGPQAGLRAAGPEIANAGAVAGDIILGEANPNPLGIFSEQMNAAGKIAKQAEVMQKIKAIEAKLAADEAAAAAGKMIPNEGFRNLEDAAKLRTTQSEGMSGLKIPEFVGKAPQDINITKQIDLEKIKELQAQRAKLSKLPVNKENIEERLQQIHEIEKQIDMEITRIERERAIEERTAEANIVNAKETPDLSPQFEAIRKANAKNIKEPPPTFENAPEDLRQSVGSQVIGEKLGIQSNTYNQQEANTIITQLSQLSDAIAENNFTDEKSKQAVLNTYHNLRTRLDEIIKAENYAREGSLYAEKQLPKYFREGGQTQSLKDLPEAPPSEGKRGATGINLNALGGQDIWEKGKNFITKITNGIEAHPADVAAEFLAKNPHATLADMPPEARFVMGGVDPRDAVDLIPNIHAEVTPNIRKWIQAFDGDIEKLHPLWKAADLTPGNAADTAIGNYLISGQQSKLNGLTVAQRDAAIATKSKIDDLIYLTYGKNADPTQVISRHIVRQGQDLAETMPEFAERINKAGSGAEIAESLLRTLNRKLYLQNSLRKARSMVAQLPTPGQQKYAKYYLDSIQGKPGYFEENLPKGLIKFATEMKFNFSRAVIGARTSSAVVNGMMGTLNAIAGPDFIPAMERFAKEGARALTGENFQQIGLFAPKPPPFLAKRPIKELMRKVDDKLYKMYDYTNTLTVGVGYWQGVIEAEKAATKKGLTGQRALDFAHQMGIRRALKIQNLGGLGEEAPIFTDPIMSAFFQFARPMVKQADYVLREMPTQFAKGNKSPLLKWLAASGAAIALGDQMGIDLKSKVFDFIPGVSNGPARTGQFAFEDAIRPVYNLLHGLIFSKEKTRQETVERAGRRTLETVIPGGKQISEAQTALFPFEYQKEEEERLGMGQKRPPLSTKERLKRGFAPGQTNEETAESKLSERGGIKDIVDPDVRREEMDKAMEELDYYIEGGTKAGRIFEKMFPPRKEKKDAPIFKFPPLYRRS